MLQRVGLMTAFGAAVVAMSAVTSQGQADFPTRPITMVVPLPAGGTADLLCRLAADKARQCLGQQVVIENRPGGAGGRVGTESVLRAAPDGYTAVVRPAAHLQHHPPRCSPRPRSTRAALEPVSVLADLSADPARARRPAGQQHGRSSSPMRKANPGKINYGHQGKGNTGHLLGELLMLKAGFRMTEIPYRGSAPAINDLLAGNIDIVPDYLLANKQNIDAGKLKLLATGSRERLKDYPNVATIAETLPGVYADTWMAVAAPPKHAEGDRQEDLGRDRAGLSDARSEGAHPGARRRSRSAVRPSRCAT